VGEGYAIKCKTSLIGFRGEIELSGRSFLFPLTISLPQRVAGVTPWRDAPSTNDSKAGGGIEDGEGQDGKSIS
jgi:hypothetical protein